MDDFACIHFLCFYFYSNPTPFTRCTTPTTTQDELEEKPVILTTDTKKTGVKGNNATGKKRAKKTKKAKKAKKSKKSETKLLPIPKLKIKIEQNETETSIASCSYVVKSLDDNGGKFSG